MPSRVGNDPAESACPRGHSGMSRIAPLRRSESTYSRNPAIPPSSLLLYVDNEVIIAIHAGGKTRHSHAGDCTVSFRTLIFSRAADNGHRSLRSAYCLLDLRRSVQLVPKNRAVIEREVVVCRKRAGAFYVIGYEDKIGGSDRPVGKRG